MGTGANAARTGEFDAWASRRPLPHSAVICAAPFVTMEFGAYGLVQACCANAMYPIGDVRRESLDEIWQGARADQLRRSLRAGQLTTGCGVCRYRLEHTPGELPRDYYDQFGYAGGEPPERPRILTFSLHNTCNLECVMCGGDESSRIRSRRDRLPPLPHVYGEAFFQQLEPYLRACEFADFVGGEPFLVREHQRVWDMLVEQGGRVKCSATTNGTVWNDRVEHVLDQLDFQITVSVDGITKETFERIRVGADFADVLRNVDRFRRYTAERGTPFSISWSLMQQNWHELGRMLEWAEERGVLVKVQTVMEPEFGVQAVPDAELQKIVTALEAEDERLRPTLRLNADMWGRELQRLQDELRLRSTTSVGLRAMRGPEARNARHIMRAVLTAPVRLRTAADATRREELLTPWREREQPASWVRIDDAGRILESTSLAELFDGTVAVAPDSTCLDQLLDDLSAGYGGGIWILEEFARDDLVEHLLFLGRTFRDKRGVVLRMISQRDDQGVVVHMATSFALAHDGVGPTPVSVVLHRGDDR